MRAVLFILVVACCLLVRALLAHADATDASVITNDLSISVPTSLPVAVPVDPPVQHVFRVIGHWVAENPGWSAVGAIVLFALLCNGLARYPKAAGVVKWLHLAIDLLAPVTRRDSPGTWKPPLVTWSQAQGWALSLSKPPADAPPQASPVAEPPKAA